MDARGGRWGAYVREGLRSGFARRGLSLARCALPDFMATAADEELNELDKILNTRYTARWEAKMGDSPGDDKELFFLNRLIRYVPDGTAWKLEVEADARHAEILLKAFRFNGKTKSVDMPEEKQVAKDTIIVDQSAELHAEQMGEYRSLVMRMAYLSQDRPDLDWLKLKRAVLGEVPVL